MSLNAPLLTKLKTVEAEHGYDPDNWPQSKLAEVQSLAARYDEPRAFTTNEDREKLEFLFQRGFFVNTIAIILHRSRTWVTVREPDEYDWIMTKEDEDKLRVHLDEGWPVSKICRKMQRSAVWVRAMEEQL